jgi:hypothetical protein
MGHQHERRCRGLKCLELDQIRIALAADLEDFLVESGFGRKVAEQQGFGYAGRLGDFLRCRAGKAPAGKERRGNLNDRLSLHCCKKVSARPPDAVAGTGNRAGKRRFGFWR